MRQTRFLRRCALVTLVTFFAATALPLSASELDLALERTPAVEALDLTLDLAVPAPEAPGAAAWIDPRAAADWRALDAAGLPAVARQDDPDDPDVGRTGSRTWRWLKRYWWVPVLVGGAIALAVQDDSPDDGEDDD